MTRVLRLSWKWILKSCQIVNLLHFAITWIQFAKVALKKNISFLSSPKIKNIWIATINLSQNILKNIEKLRNLKSSELKDYLDDFTDLFHYLKNTKDNSYLHLSGLNVALTQISALMSQGRRIFLSELIKFPITWR